MQRERARDRAWARQVSAIRYREEERARARTQERERAMDSPLGGVPTDFQDQDGGGADAEGEVAGADVGADWEEELSVSEEVRRVAEEEEDDGRRASAEGVDACAEHADDHFADSSDGSGPWQVAGGEHGADRVRGWLEDEEAGQRAKREGDVGDSDGEGDWRDRDRDIFTPTAAWLLGYAPYRERQRARAHERESEKEREKVCVCPPCVCVCVCMCVCVRERERERERERAFRPAGLRDPRSWLCDSAPMKSYSSDMGEAKATLNPKPSTLNPKP